MKNTNPRETQSSLTPPKKRKKSYKETTTGKGIGSFIGGWASTHPYVAKRFGVGVGRAAGLKTFLRQGIAASAVGGAAGLAAGGAIGYGIHKLRQRFKSNKKRDFHPVRRANSQ